MPQILTASPEPKGPHPSKPTAEWLKLFLEHVKQTGQPETFPGIERCRPPSASRPLILHRFDVDRKKRPNLDMAPCAMCSPFAEKCLEDLCVVWYEDEGVVRIIGPECGDGLAGGDLLRAERKAFDLRQRQDRAADFLEKNLPKMSAWGDALRGCRPALAEAERLHHKLRHDHSAIPKKFRIVRNHGAGLLQVNVQIKREKVTEDEQTSGERPERVGPKGFGKGADAVDSYTEQMGILDGAAMFAANYEPIQELEGLLRLIEALPKLRTDEDAFLWLCSNESLGLFEHVVEQIRKIQASFDKLMEHLDSIIAFFAKSNFDRIHRWGAHEEAEFQIEATNHGGVFTLIHNNRRSKMTPNFDALNIRMPWPRLE